MDDPNSDIKNVLDFYKKSRTETENSCKRSLSSNGPSYGDSKKI